jgi:hypothetical protein
VRYSIALACLLSSLSINTTLAQCPSTQPRGCSVTTQRSHCSPPLKTRRAAALTRSVQPGCSVQPSYTVRPGCSMQQRSTMVQGYSVVENHRTAQRYYSVEGYPVVQSCPVQTGGTNASVQMWSLAPQATTVHTVISQNAQHISQGNCNCNGALPTFSTSPSPQNASILERNPFSLAGHAQAVRPPDFCAAEFFACCESGAKDCLLNYYKCAEITGEQIKHTECPAASAKAKPQ